MARRSLIITYVLTYLLAAGSILRILITYRAGAIVQISLLIAGYLILLLSGSFFINRSRALTYVYLAIQTVFIYALSLLTPGSDFWVALFYPLIVQVMHNFPRRTGFLITGAFSLITTIFILTGLGLETGLPLVFIYAVVYFLLAAFIAIIREAEASNAELQQQQEELQAAHEQLQTYTAHAEELAVLQERNRLARELHDSVTQSLHSSTLMAEAGRRLADSGDIARARGYFVRLGDISQQALKEMRLLVYELRPLALRDIGLVEALQQRLDSVERRSGVEVKLSVEERLELPESLEEELFRIAMEALNNSIKHGNPNTVTVALRKEEKQGTPCIELTVIDDGIGFDPADRVDEGGLGLVSMQERIEKLGGELSIVSIPGKGTEVNACVGLVTAQGSPALQEI